jgi:hypothetical protein
MKAVAFILFVFFYLLPVQGQTNLILNGRFEENTMTDTCWSVPIISSYFFNYRHVVQGGGTLDSLTDSAKITLLSYLDTTLPSSGFIESIITDAHSPNIQQIPENGGKQEERKANSTQRTITASDINDAKTFNIYPNPTMDNIILEFSLGSDKWVTITVMDNLGNILFNKKIENIGKYSLSTDALNLAGGMYTIKLTGEKSSDTRTFVKINE